MRLLNRGWEYACHNSLSLEGLLFEFALYISDLALVTSLFIALMYAGVGLAKNVMEWVRCGDRQQNNDAQ